MTRLQDELSVPLLYDNDDYLENPMTSPPIPFGGRRRLFGIPTFHQHAFPFTGPYYRPLDYTAHRHALVSPVLGTLRSLQYSNLTLRDIIGVKIVLLIDRLLKEDFELLVRVQDVSDMRAQWVVWWKKRKASFKG